MRDFYAVARQTDADGPKVAVEKAATTGYACIVSTWKSDACEVDDQPAQRWMMTEDNVLTLMHGLSLALCEYRDRKAKPEEEEQVSKNQFDLLEGGTTFSSSIILADDQFRIKALNEVLGEPAYQYVIRCPQNNIQRADEDDSNAACFWYMSEKNIIDLMGILTQALLERRDITASRS